MLEFSTFKLEEREIVSTACTSSFSGESGKKSGWFGTTAWRYISLANLSLINEAILVKLINRGAVPDETRSAEIWIRGIIVFNYFHRCVFCS